MEEEQSYEIAFQKKFSLEQNENNTYQYINETEGLVFRFFVPFPLFHQTEVSMSERMYSCPLCDALFRFGDGMPDMYGVRLCSDACRDTWLTQYHYRAAPDEVVAQCGDPSSPMTPQVADMPLEDPRLQMG